MSFYRKYELDRLIADGEAKTFRALENATGRLVFLHLFNPAGQPLLAMLKSRLGGVTGKPRPPLIEIGEFAGSPYAVTYAIEPFTNLRDWIEANVMLASPLLDDDSSPKIEPTLEPSLPKVVAPRDPTPLLADTPTPARAPSAPPPHPASSHGLVDEAPGEFTRLFENPAPPPAPRRVSPAPIPPAPQPGEFTRLFENPDDEPPAIAPAPADAGEFTRMFSPPGGKPPAPSKPPSPQLVDDGPNEFTSLFPPSAPPAIPRAEKPPLPPSRSLTGEAPGEFTSLFPPSAPPAIPRAEKPPLPPSRSLTGEAPGEFTSLFPPSAPPAISRAEKPPLPSQSLTGDAPGEFTSLFPPSAPPARPEPPMPRASAPPPSRPPLWPPDSPAQLPHESPETGQFSRLFGSRLSGEAIDIEKEQASAARSTPPENRPFQPAGEFTRMFGPQGPGAPPKDPRPPAMSADSRLTSASGLFGDPDELAKAAKEVLSKPGKQGSEPGEYTRMFDAPKRPAEPAKPPAVAPISVPESAPPRKSNRDTIILVVIAAVVMLALIVVAVMLARK